MTKVATKRVRPSSGETAEKILRAALQLFSKLGYDGSTTAAIAKKAGTTEKTLFQHFGSKEELFRRTAFPALLRAVRPALFDLSSPGKDNPSADELLLSLASERIRFAVEHPEVVKMLSQEVLLRPEFRRSFVKHWSEQVLPSALGLVRGLKKRGKMRDLPEGTVLRILISMTVGYVLTRTLIAPDKDWNDEREAALMIDVLVNGIARR